MSETQDSSETQGDDVGELLIKRIGAMRLNSNWLVGYIAGHSPELMNEILTELEASELSEWAVDR